jgi:hypothetical protein
MKGIGGEPAVSAALHALHDRDTEVVAEALSLLHEHPPRQRDLELYKIFKTIDDPFAREQIPMIAGRLSPNLDSRPWIDEMTLREETGVPSDGLVTGLARMGHPRAREHFVRRLLAAQGRRSPAWIERCAYMEDTWIVAPMAPMLDRYEFALSLNPDDPDSYLRTCDLAVEVIVALTKAEFDFPVKRIERYTGPELSKVKEIAAQYK